RMYAQAGQSGHGAGHQAFAARLVDGSRPGFVQHDRQPGPHGVQRGRQPDRPAAGDHQVGHGDGPPNKWSAEFSVRMRTASSTALARVNTTAVIHAVCTRGSANPSTTTAT